VLLAREFGWTLEEMRQLRPSELAAVLRELQRQRLLSDYHEMRNKWAFLAAVITNVVGALAAAFGKRKHKPIEPDAFIADEVKRAVARFTGQAAQAEKRETDWDALVAEAKAKGLAGPW